MSNTRWWFVMHFFLCFSSLFAVVPFSGQATEIIYPSRESLNDTRNDDVVELLEMILERTVSTDGPYTMRPAAGNMNEARSIELLKQGQYLNLIWATTTGDVEDTLLPIYIPVRKGILGYRIFLIHQQEQEKFSKITTLQELRSLIVGQGHWWNDVKVFEANGFKVVTGSKYEGLFKMLIQGRFDYFSRGFNEAFEEYDARKYRLKDLHVEQTLLLYYPWPKFFYVSLKYPEIKDRVERGFRLLIADGTYQQWFLKYNKEAIDRANLKGRRLFIINNPLLPDFVPIHDKPLWYDPFQ